jgi:hypothetical protein
MPQSSTLYVGFDVHQESTTMAYIAEDHGAEVISLIRTARASIPAFVP